MLDRHGRLGNDSETCWLLYAALKLQIEVPDVIAENIIRNCGSLSIVAILNCVEAGLASKSIFNSAFDLLSQENADGPLWPVFLEWGSKNWDRHAEVDALVASELIKTMSKKGACVFGSARLTRVFRGVDEVNFGGILSAIEKRISSYDDEDEKGEEGQNSEL